MSSQPVVPTTEAPTSQRTPSPRARRRFGGAFAPLANGNFRLLVGGQLISNIGDMFYAVALPWYMLTQGGGAQDLGIVLLAYGTPRIGTVLLGGSLADRFRPRRIMLLADVARAVLTGALAGLVVVGTPLLWQLCAVSALLGAFSGLFMPGSFSILPDILPDEQLQAGNAFNSSSAQLATLVGAGIAGAVVTFFTPGMALAVDAGTFAVSALTLAAMRPRARESLHLRATGRRRRRGGCAGERRWARGNASSLALAGDLTAVPGDPADRADR
jgi:MFS family permease